MWVLTNFDTEHLSRITDAGVRIVSNQVQFSLIDRRPEVAMIPFANRTGSSCWPMEPFAVDY